MSKFSNTKHELAQKGESDWGWYSIDSNAKKHWNGGYATKKAAQSARRKAIADFMLPQKSNIEKVSEH